MTAIRTGNLARMGAVIVLLGGCASPEPSARNFTVAHVTDGDRRSLFETAESVLTDLGYRIDRRDWAAGVLTAKPIPAPTGAESARRSLRLSSSGRMRRVAQVRIAQAHQAVDVSCSVVVEEQVTEAHRMFRREQGGTDIPTATPIEREAATTTRQNIVWRPVRRDRTAEREILAVITRDVGEPAQPSGVDRSQ